MTYVPSSPTNSPAPSSVVSEDLDIGPSLLEPGARERSDYGSRVARLVIIPLLLMLVVIVLVFYVLFVPSKVDGQSMEPTLLSGDRMLVTRGYRVPHRGDIIDIHMTDAGQTTELVKRVIAIAGDTIEIRADVAWVNGVPEPARGQLVQPSFAVNVAPYIIQQGYLYVLGDNRAVSEDSRFFGPLPLSGAEGKVVAIFSPVTRLRLVH